MPRIQHCESREEWLKVRKGGIGSSDIAAICGMSRFASPWSTWAHKLGRLPDQTGDDVAADMGRRLESVIAGLFRDKLEDTDVPVGWRLDDLGDHAIVWADDPPWAFCTADRFMVSPNDEWFANVELKAAYHGAAREFRKRYPMAYRAQVTWQLMCCGLDRAYHAILMNGLDFKYYREDRSDKLIASLRRRAEQFWGFVQEQKEPPVDFSQATARALAASYNEPKPEQVWLPKDAEQWHADIEAWSAKKSEAERHVNTAKNRIKAAMGNNQVGLLTSGDKGYSWKPRTDGVRVFKFEPSINGGEQ